MPQAAPRAAIPPDFYELLREVLELGTMNHELKLLVLSCVVLCGCAGDDPFRTACQALSERQRLIGQHTWASNRPDNSRFDCDEYLAKQRSRRNL